ncbi:predicted protein [Sclerotinia sclerotiorum 1980 UF-70]|uniref:Uncharacterized protein n=1 Tax=Sclerotinia sclerotiorum (strain ATCC 18683 / 1980 / Ss-1) TaxID=665079 RepID=A7EAN9_SCLS1|nr:predicted protein [Sclerotinia sclerotiorum 1980 UF-70]EDN99517.1 predicted protein [Sclerotinia sclerotiorum 1980 UF-70]
MHMHFTPTSVCSAFQVTPFWGEETHTTAGFYGLPRGSPLFLMITLSFEALNSCLSSSKVCNQSPMHTCEYSQRVVDDIDAQS